MRLILISPLLRLAAFQRFIQSRKRASPTSEELARTQTTVWGELDDGQRRRAISRLYGPEAGVNWTSLAALAAVLKVLAGEAPPGFQTPLLAYGADFVLECEGVTREDLN